MDDLLLALVICMGLIGFAVFYVFTLMFFGLLFLAICAFWYISIPLFCIYVYFKYFRKEKKFEAKVFRALKLFCKL